MTRPIEAAVLQVAGLNLYLDATDRRLHVVRGVDIDLQRAEVLGLIGESGSGKTMTGMSLLRLEPEQSEISAATMRVAGADLLGTSRRGLRQLRGSTIAMIFQDPVGAFNPAKRIDWHARQVLRRRDPTLGRRWRRRALELLTGFPAYGFTRPTDSFVGAMWSGFLPALAIAVPMAGIFSRMLRTTLLETFRRAYVVSAHAMGFGRNFIFWHYVFRNALIPYVTAIGLQARYLLGGVVVIERVFGVPGVGSVMVDAAFARDYGVVQGCAVVFLMIVIATNLLVDAICGLLDPKRAV